MTVTGLTATNHGTLQSLLALLQVANVDALTAAPWFHLIPKKYAGWLIVGVGVIQAGFALYHQYVNPDGTSAAVAYVPPGK